MLHHAWLFILQLSQNPMFSGIIGASVIGGGMYVLRETPEKIWHLLLGVISREFKVTNDNTGFEWFEKWLTGHRYTDSFWCRTMRLTIDPSSTIEHDDYTKTLAPGVGTHFMFYKGWPITIHRYQDNEGGMGLLKKREGFDIRIFFAPRRVMRELVDEAESIAKQLPGRIPLLVWTDGWWTKAPPLRPRDLDTVYLPDGLRDNIVEDVQIFTRSQEWYVARGVPYRRGYLLTGTPGSGKTTLAIAMASLLKRSMYVIALSNISDSNLFLAVMSLPRNAILLLEDVDTVKQTEARSGGKTASKIEPQDEKQGQLSLGGLLNALDGVFSSEGRIVVMTTNCPGKLDTALVRPGRADYRLDFPLADAQVMVSMFNKFYEGSEFCLDDFQGYVEQSPAYVQEVLIANRGSSEKAIAKLKETA